MEYITALIFIVGWVIFYFQTKHETEIDFRERKIKELEKKNYWLKIEKEIESKKLEKVKIENKNVLTPEQIERSKRAIEKISNKLGKPATLEDLVRYSIEARGLEITEQKFQGAVRVADAAGLETSNWEDIYDKYFEDE